MKNNYLEELKKLLSDYQMEDFEKQDILSDYEEIYEGWTEKGLNDEEVEKKLGNPRSIIKDLTEGYRKVEKPIPGGERIIALSPFLATITFFILGFGFNLWHPGWLVFFIIPILGIFTGKKGMSVLNLFVSLSPFVATIIFVFLYDNGDAVPGWLIFLIIPILGIINEKNIIKMMIMELLIIFGIILYLYLGYNYTDMWGYALVSFVPITLYSIIVGDIEVGIGGASKEYKILILITTIVFFLLGFLLNLWEVAWLIFLLIPVYAINKEVPEKDKLVSISPFIALTLFFLLGYFLNIWEYSWLAFFIIPIIAIVKNVK